MITIHTRQLTTIHTTNNNTHIFMHLTTYDTICNLCLDKPLKKFERALKLTFKMYSTRSVNPLFCFIVPSTCFDPRELSSRKPLLNKRVIFKPYLYGWQITDPLGYPTQLEESEAMKLHVGRHVGHRKQRRNYGAGPDINCVGTVFCLNTNFLGQKAE